MPVLGAKRKRRLLTVETVTMPVVTLGNTGGNTVTIVPTSRDLFGNTVATTYTFVSSVPAKMTVNPTTGVLTRVAAGPSDITATEVSTGKTVTTTIA